ncbi:helix-turn-helix domain-containing protein [Streptomyces sp. NPDC056227]|uniref:helix-turn-helix domain-containing protein n=1 Tax=Streptomyces sp. NPDC056227 TaxID=3345753 RepID=UPI0035DFE977
MSVPPAVPVPPACSDAVDLAATGERTMVDLAGRGLEPLVVLGRYRYLRAQEPLPVQRHCSLVVLALPGRGSFAFEVDGRVREVSPGQVLCVPPGSVYLTGTTAQARGELTWLIARRRGTREERAAALDRAVSLLADPPVSQVWDVSPETAGDLRRAFDLAAGKRDWLADARLQHVLAALVCDLAATMAAARTPGPGPVHQSITRTLAWIDAHLAEAADAAELATVSGLSTSHFYEAFRQATGTSPKDYLLRRKTDRARAWLEDDPSVTVTEVAHALGFSSSQYFATVFRRYQHCAPSSCRPGGR